MRRVITITAIATLTIGLGAFQREPVDAAVNAKIVDEGQNRSQTAAMFTYLVDTIGPRLTGSDAHKRAAEWARDQMAKWGLANPHLEPFAFGRGWALEKFTIEMIEPRYMPLIGYPEAWSPSTSGELVATVVSVAGKTPEEVVAMKGSLKGAAVLQQAPVTNFIRGDRVQPADVSEEENQKAAAAAAARGQAGAARAGGGGGGGGRGAGGGRGGDAAPGATPSVATTIGTSGAAVLLKGSRGEHGTLFVQGANRPAAADEQPPKVMLIGEHYNLLARLAAQGVPVKVRVNVKARMFDDPNTYNVIAEIPGTDPALRDEVVLLGAHLDSWHTATGATDNADGSVTAMEAFRILKTIGVRPRRTLRLALWSGEEEGLLGSVAYVRDHLTGDANAAARAKLAVYFNIDPGKGPIYGWFMENNAEARPIFDAWLAPFTKGQAHDLGARKNVPQGIGNTDHLSFIRQGMLGFNPIQDYNGYDEREHHTNVDTAERVDDKDLKQTAIILASFVYHAAMRTERIPAK